MCPDGFELNGDEKTCRDIDECTTLSDYEYEDNVPTARSICSHECVNTLGSYLCKCPLNFHLRDDKRTCEQDFCRHLGDVASNKTKCSHDCVDDGNVTHPFGCISIQNIILQLLILFQLMVTIVNVPMVWFWISI